ncbi:7713_t:CDS:2 [Gigaspora rosea]|nr:7713_t:CDS:2 [Gigaspora rosea]
MSKGNTFRITTLNVKGLNNRYKCQKTMTLFKTYKIELIMLQETNLTNDSTRNFLKQQWRYDSIWTARVAILVANREIKSENIKESHQERVLCTEFQYGKWLFRVINVYVLEERVLAGDFNVNLDPDINRISHVIPHNDLSKEKLKKLTHEMVDTSVAASQTPFITYSQKTRGGHTMATRLDYIFVDKQNAQIAKRRIQSLVARNKDLSNLQLEIERLKRNLQDELTNLADKWQVHSNARWIESGEKSTKYFYSRFKTRHNAVAIDKIKILNNIGGSNPIEVLHYIKEYYSYIYQQEPIKKEAIDRITNGLPQIEKFDNQSLIKYIMKEEISEVIHSLLNNKTPGIDGITYEFYKELIEESSLVFEKIFNDVIKKEKMPSSVNHGVRQGDPLSPLLYVLVFEPFLRSLGKNLMEIALNQHSRQQRFKLMAYADDLTISIALHAE